MLSLRKAGARQTVYALAGELASTAAGYDYVQIATEIAGGSVG